MIVAAIRFELVVAGVQSLKAKRAVVRPLVEGLRRMASISVAEVAHHDSWQRCALGVAIVTVDQSTMDTLIERVRARIEQNVEVEIIEARLDYLEVER
ncbi:MAG: DUF503 domain-containing protein [Acidimicrobiia bacterium]|nr:DUF503 domain-containing protein [Acidimicrobiia bacterium]MDH4306821.1 DUF503 domain-containing protein [Acidimicrobiia bacterium]